MLSYRLGTVNDFYWGFKPVFRYNKPHKPYYRFVLMRRFFSELLSEMLDWYLLSCFSMKQVFYCNNVLGNSLNGDMIM